MEPKRLRILPPPQGIPLPLPARPGLLSSLGMAAFAVLLLLVGSNFDAIRIIPLASFRELTLLFAATFIALLVHEIGHWLAALACRFEILTFSVGPFRIAQSSNRWRIYLRKTSVFTGSVSALPRSNEVWREKMMVVVAAGPLATFLSILGGSCYQNAPSVWGEFVSYFVQISLIILVLGLLPNARNAAVQNDAALFCSLWRDGAEGNALFLYHLVVQHQRSGLEPHEFPLWLIELMATFKGRPDFMVLYATMIASWAFDCGDRQSGDLWDQRALQLSAAANLPTRQACLANSACFDLIFREDHEAARAKLAQIRIEALSSPVLQHSARAIRHLAFGKVRKTLAEVAEARSLLASRQKDRGFECFLLRHIHACALSIR